MPTFPTFDPANLPPYPEKPHKTGQARVNVDGKSQYLGKYGTVESHALYHLACSHKLITGLVPTTRELRDKMSHVAGDTTPRAAFPSLMTVIGLLVLVSMTSGLLSHFITKVSVRKISSQQVVTHKPVLPNTDLGEKSEEGDNRRPALNSATSLVVEETSAAFPDASISEALGFAAERFKIHRERSRENGKGVDAMGKRH